MPITNKKLNTSSYVGSSIKIHAPQAADKVSKETSTSNPEPRSTRTLEEEILAAKSLPSFGIVASLGFITIILAYSAYDTSNTVAVAIWVVAMITMMVLRISYQKRLATDSSVPLKRRINHTTLLSGAAGLVHTASFYFTPDFNLTEKTIQSVLMMGLINGAVSTNSGYRPFFLAYSLPVILGLTFSWATPNFETDNQILAYVVAALMTIYYGVMYSNAANHFKLFKESYEIRGQQSKLNAKLEKKNSQLDSALNQALEARQEADSANKSKTRFLASASHDLRQPTHALSLLAGVLTRQNLDTKSMSIALDIHQASQNLQALMNGLLDISKLDAGLMVPKIESMDLTWLITRVCNEFEAQAYDKGLKLLFISDYGSASTRSDPQLTERILRNLVSNAVKYTDNGKITVFLEKSEGEWVVSVADTGCGIDLEEQERIFEEFYQIGNSHRDSANGLGLGLAIVKRLSDKLKLDIKCESRLQQGSTFSFSLPFLDDCYDQKLEITSNETLEGIHILCVDDEADIRKAMRLVFELLECTFDLVEGIDEAIAAAKTLKPDIVLADYRLVGELNGVDTIHAIRNIYPNVPALLVTGDTSPERLKLASEANIEMLHKPLTMEKLVSAVSDKTKNKK